MSYINSLLTIGLYICLAWMAKSVQECLRATEEPDERFYSMKHELTSLLKKKKKKGLELTLVGLALLLASAKPSKRANRGNCSATWTKICHSERLQWKEAFHFSTKNWQKVPTGSWLDVPWAKYFWLVIWMAHCVCNGMFAETKDREERELYFIGLLLYSDSARGDL